jgi:hypothetical protein
MSVNLWSRRGIAEAITPLDDLHAIREQRGSRISIPGTWPLGYRPEDRRAISWVRLPSQPPRITKRLRPRSLNELGSGVTASI